MVIFLIVLLVISQIICFYFIILLNTKIAKFNDLEARQDRLIREMDDAMVAYLLEMKEENDRLIQELSTIQKTNENKEHNEPISIQMKENEKELTLETKTFIPKNIAKNAYNRQKQQTSNQEKKVKLVETEIADEKVDSVKNQIITLHSQGKTIEEIAKLTRKGKTEIELLLKFQA